MFKNNLIVVLCFGVVAFMQFTSILAGISPFELSLFGKPYDPKIINGTEANPNTTRHQVSIRYRRKDSYFFGIGHICGGSLISENVVLSAAHCFVDYKPKVPDGTFLPDEDFIAVMGNVNRFEYNNALVFDKLKIIKRVKIFNLSTFDDDIVIIILNGIVPAKHPTVRPIILNDAPLANNTICQATGWGDTEEGYPPELLMSVDLPIIDYYDCRNKTLYGTAIHPGMLCAGYLEGERDACQGDSGGALVCLGLQAGIVSFGVECAEPLFPGVYTEVAFYKQWILDTVAANNGTLPKFAPGGNDGGNSGGNGSGNGGGNNGGNNGGNGGGNNGGSGGGNGGGNDGGNNGCNCGGSDGGNNGGNNSGNGGGTGGGNDGGNNSGNGGGNDGGNNGSGDNNNGGNGVAGLSCSLALVSLMLVFHFVHSQMK